MKTIIPIAWALTLLACEQAELQETESVEPSPRAADAGAADAGAADDGSVCVEPSAPASFTPSGREAGADERGPEQPARTSLARDASSSPGVERSVTLADVVVLGGPTDPGSAAFGATTWRAGHTEPRDATATRAAE